MILAHRPDMAINQRHFESNWESLGHYTAPKWFRDAKFGIWAHWGPQAVPEEGDWYARNMYIEGSKQYEAHLKAYGHPSVHGYREIIDQWHAERWNPDELMQMFKAAGAKYFFSMGVHHDNFDLWDSKFHRWNAVKMGPHKDIVGGWQRAAKKEGLKFGVSEHLGASYNWWYSSKGADTSGPMKDVPYDGNDPTLQDLYHPMPTDKDLPWYTTNDAWHKEWFQRVNDLISSYHPDILYSDGGVPFGEYGRQIIATLYNQGPGRVYLAKDLGSGAFERGAFIEDRERGGAEGIQDLPWQVDTSIGDWFYNKHWPYRKADWVLKTLIDTSSKNGNMLLNVVLRPDGGIDPEVKMLLDDLALWMNVNGESIFGTRPWITFGEGPTRVKSGSFREDYPFSEKDVRYATKGSQTLYATLLGPVSNQRVNLVSLSKGRVVKGVVKAVHLLGVSRPLSFTHDERGLSVQVPKNDSRFVTVLKITCSDVRAFKPPAPVEPPQRVFDLNGGTISMSPVDARLQGALSYEDRSGEPNLAYWFNESDSASWKVKVASPLKVRITSQWANLEPSEISISVVQGSQIQTVTRNLDSTGDWGAFRLLDFGELDLPQGECQIVVKPVPQHWKPINLRGLKIEVLP